MKMYFITSDMPLFPMEYLDQLGRESSKYGIQVQANDVSDGYHTMEELYQHRYHLYLALVKVLDSYVTPLGSNILCWKSKLHDDGTMFEGDFILGMTITKPSFELGKESEDFYITYHLPLKYWHFIKVIELEKAPPYDGHTSDDVLQRLLRL